MDILTVLHSAFCPLTYDEIRERSGAMFSADRLDSLVRSGDIRTVAGDERVYWAVPAAQRKGAARRCQSPLKTGDRARLVQQIADLSAKLGSVDRELAVLSRKRDTFPTEAQLREHMQRLHRYNDAKDIAQTIMGGIADAEGVKVEAVYEEYGLSANE